MDTFEFNVDEKLRPSVERTMTGTTLLDSKIDSLPLPSKSYFKKIAILMLRLYRKLTPFSIRNRCVFDPSCSHYSELAIREHGVIKGAILTSKRLHNCKSGNGGIDLSNINKEI